MAAAAVDLRSDQTAEGGRPHMDNALGYFFFSFFLTNLRPAISKCPPSTILIASV
jgi:hypothetical protein